MIIKDHCTCITFFLSLNVETENFHRGVKFFGTSYLNKKVSRWSFGLPMEMTSQISDSENIL